MEAARLSSVRRQRDELAKKIEKFKANLPKDSKKLDEAKRALNKLESDNQAAKAKYEIEYEMKRKESLSNA